VKLHRIPCADKIHFLLALLLLPEKRLIHRIALFIEVFGAGHPVAIWTESFEKSAQVWVGGHVGAEAC